MFAVAAETEELGNDQLRSASLTSLADGEAENAETSREVRPIHVVFVDTITLGSIGKRSAGELTRGGSRIGVLIIGYDQHQRKLFYRGLIDCLVEGAGGSRAITDTRCSYRARDAFEPAGP